MQPKNALAAGAALLGAVGPRLDTCLTVVPAWEANGWVEPGGVYVKESEHIALLTSFELPSALKVMVLVECRHEGDRGPRDLRLPGGRRMPFGGADVGAQVRDGNALLAEYAGAVDSLYAAATDHGLLERIMRAEGQESSSRRNVFQSICDGPAVYIGREGGVTCFGVDPDFGLGGGDVIALDPSSAGEDMVRRIVRCVLDDRERRDLDGDGE